MPFLGRWLMDCAPASASLPRGMAGLAFLEADDNVAAAPRWLAGSRGAGLRSATDKLAFSWQLRPPAVFWRCLHCERAAVQDPSHRPLPHQCVESSSSSRVSTFETSTLGDVASQAASRDAVRPEKKEGQRLSSAEEFG